jgi:hypothetical protein
MKSFSFVIFGFMVEQDRRFSSVPSSSDGSTIIIVPYSESLLKLILQHSEEAPAMDGPDPLSDLCSSETDQRPDLLSGLEAS